MLRHIYVIDDDREIRMSLTFQLRTLDYDVQAFVDPRDFLDRFDTLRPGCVLLDMRMPGMDGSQALLAMREAGVHWPVIVMTGHAEVSMAVESMKNGAVDFLEKPFEDQELQDALKAGFDRLDADLARAESRKAADGRLARLSPREREVLGLMLEGEPNKALAFRLDLSVRTIEMHRANLLAKLECRNMVEAAALLAGRVP